jgi:release factor glutamine methyltransferase
MTGGFFDALGQEESTAGGRISARDLLYDAERRLTIAGVPSPQADAALLLSWVLEVPRNRLFLNEAPTGRQKVAFEKALARRLTRVPLQHITGRAPFRRIEVPVGPGVFIPRPETELITEAGVRVLRGCESGIGVDLCAGSGAAGLSLALEAVGSTVHLVELDDAAVEWTRGNATHFAEELAQAGSSVHVVHGDAGEVAEAGAPLVSLIGRVDVVVANPPYIPDSMVPREVEVREHDPYLALYGGPDGLDVVRRIVRTAALLLRSGGLLAMEHADTQGPDAPGGGVVGVVSSWCLDQETATLVPGVPGAPAFTGVTDRRDFAGLPRFTLATRANP